MDQNACFLTSEFTAQKTLNRSKSCDIVKIIKKEHKLGRQRILFDKRGINQDFLKLSREETVGVVLSAMRKVNSENLKNRSIKKSF